MITTYNDYKLISNLHDITVYGLSSYKYKNITSFIACAVKEFHFVPDKTTQSVGRNGIRPIIRQPSSPTVRCR